MAPIGDLTVLQWGDLEDFLGACFQWDSPFESDVSDCIIELEFSSAKDASFVLWQPIL